jgi:hypothetical protein
MRVRTAFARWSQGGGRETEAIAMRRIEVIVALGALQLGMFGVVVTALPAFAARRPKLVRFGCEGGML